MRAPPSCRTDCYLTCVLSATASERACRLRQVHLDPSGCFAQCQVQAAWVDAAQRVRAQRSGAGEKQHTCSCRHRKVRSDVLGGGLAALSMHGVLWQCAEKRCMVMLRAQAAHACRSAGESRVVYTSHGMLQWHMFTQGVHKHPRLLRIDSSMTVVHNPRRSLRCCCAASQISSSRVRPHGRHALTFARDACNLVIICCRC